MGPSVCLVEASTRSGKTLAYLSRLQRLHGRSRVSPWKDVVAECTLKLLAFQVLSGLAFLREHRCIHGDVKPPNILISQGMVNLVDFGISRLPGAGKKRSLTFVEIELYMSPECLHALAPSRTSASVDSRSARRRQEFRQRLKLQLVAQLPKPPLRTG